MPVCNPSVTGPKMLSCHSPKNRDRPVSLVKPGQVARVGNPSCKTIPEKPEWQPVTTH